jgi:hypothetical protein
MDPEDRGRIHESVEWPLILSHIAQISVAIMSLNFH